MVLIKKIIILIILLLIFNNFLLAENKGMIDVNLKILPRAEIIMNKNNFILNFSEEDDVVEKFIPFKIRSNTPLTLHLDIKKPLSNDENKLNTYLAFADEEKNIISDEFIIYNNKKWGKRNISLEIPYDGKIKNKYIYLKGKRDNPYLKAGNYNLDFFLTLLF